MAKKITVVGAGLAGLTAAINLARDGYEVTVLEKEKKTGGRPEFRPDGAGSPFDADAIESYTGIDITPAIQRIDRSKLIVYGKRYDRGIRPDTPAYMVERSARKTSIDTYLYDLAVESGVKVKFGEAIKTNKDISDLPPNTIIATGLDIDGFEAMNIPYVHLWGWFAKGKHDSKDVNVWIYMDDFSVDYAFASTINETKFALLFQRTKPLKTEGKKKFERMMAEDGLEFSKWQDLEGGCSPHYSIRNPLLFKGDKIVIGTLGGVMEPVLNFGMCGALISGKIGATAVEDKGRAYEDFRKLTKFFSKSLMLKRAIDRSPRSLHKVFMRAGAGFLEKYEDKLSLETINKGFGFVPGYGDF